MSETTVSAWLVPYRREDQVQSVNEVNQRGMELFRQGDADGACKAFALAVDQAPDNAAYRVNLGLALMQLQRHSEALFHLSAAYETRRDDATLAFALVKTLASLAQYDAARELYCDFLSRFPDSLDVRVQLYSEPWAAEVDPTLCPLGLLGMPQARTIETYVEAFTRSLEFVLASRTRGPVMEFGTYRGGTAFILAQSIRKLALPVDLCLFDSFEGLPAIVSCVDQVSYEVRDGAWFDGQMRSPSGMDERVAQVVATQIPRERLHVVKGFYEHTVPAQLPTIPATLVHVDCDLYESTRHVLASLVEQNLLQDGTVLMFDDYNCGRANPRLGQRRALADVFGAQTRWALSPWFSYGWFGQAYFVHDNALAF